MATPCVTLPNGKTYTFDEFATLLHDGELNNLVNNGTLKGDFVKDIPDELKAVKNEATPTDDSDINTQNVPELDIKIERGGVFSGEFLNNYEFLAEGSEHTVYKSKDGKTVIKIGEPYNSNEGYQPRVDDALAINNLLGDGSLEVIGTYKSPNGTINPVYQQNFIEGNTATQEQVAEHLINNGFTQTGKDTFTINKGGKTLKISDTSDNFIINSDNKIIAIDASIREIKNEATPTANIPTIDEVKKIGTIYIDSNGNEKVIVQVNKSGVFFVKDNTNEKQNPTLGDENDLAQLIKNEATPATNIPTNGNVQPGIEPMAEVGIEQKQTTEVIAEEGIQPTVKPKPTKGKTKITQEPTLEDIENFLNEQFTKNESDTGTKTESVQEDSGVGEKEEPVKKPSRKGKTPLDKRKIKDKEMITALKMEVFDAYSLAQQFFIGGGRVLASDIKALLGSSTEARLRIGYARSSEKGGSTVDGIANYLWETYGENLNLDTSDFKEAVENVISSFTSTKSMAVDLNERNDIEFKQNQYYNEDFYENAKNLALVEQNDHNEALSYFDVLTDEEIAKLADERQSFEDFLAEEENKQNLKEENIIDVFHGGSIKSLSDIDGEVYVSMSESQAKEYAKGNGGTVTKFKIDQNIVANEEDIRKVLKELDLKSKEEGWDLDDLNLYEIIDTNFDTSVSEKDKEVLFQKLAEKGYKAIIFLDSNLETLKNDIYNIVVLDKNVLKEENKQNLKEEQEKISNKVRKLKIDLSKLSDGGLQSNPLGLPVAIWNASMDIIATSIDAGIEISEAIKRGMNYIEKNYKKEWNKDLFYNTVIKQSGLIKLQPNQIEQKNIISLGDNLIKAIVKADQELRADGKGSKEIGVVLRETLTINEDNILYNQNKEYKKLYDKSEQTELTKEESERISEIYKAESVKKQVALIGKIYQEQKNAGNNSIFVQVVDKLLTQQRKDLANAEVDKIADKIKKLLPGIKDPDIHTQGFSQDQLIDLVVKAVKNLINAKIEIDEAIKQVAKSIKDKFGIEVNPDDVKSRLEPKKEVEQEPTLSQKQSTEFRDAIKNIPNSGNIKKYLSGETIEENYGTPENPQEYDAKILLDLSQHGIETIAKAKELFGEQYIEKTLEYLESSDLNTFEKAIQYVALMNDIDQKLQKNPKDLNAKKLQKLVYAKYQANARIGSLTINVGRLMSIMKFGIDTDKRAEKLFTSKQKEAKSEVEKIIQVTPDQINEMMDSESDEMEKAISEGVEKRINEMYSKLPTSRRIKADKAIIALENIQKRLRGRAYDATIGIPIQLIDSSIVIIKNAIKYGTNIADAIELGIDHIKQKYGKKWDNEDRFRDDMFSEFKKEGINVSKVEKTIKDTVKELLIEAGFSREVKSKGEVKTLFDWKKLAGEEGGIDKIKENVETVLKSKGYSDSEIQEMSKSFEDEYNRLSEEIINKGFAELENRNLIKPSPNRKSEAKTLAELYNYGLMEEDSVKYDNVMNKVLGLSDLDAESYQKIKNATKALADVFKAQRTEGRLTEKAVGTLVNQINHQIKNILHSQSFRNGPLHYKIGNILSEFAGLAQKALLQNPGNAVENILSAFYASIVSRGSGRIKKELTPEIRKQNKINARVIFNDLNANAGLFYGDTNTNLISESRVEQWLNGKSDNKLYHGILSVLTGRMYLEAIDSMVKSEITNTYFVKNAVEILTNKSNKENRMSEEEALIYVSENITGVKFKEALIEAKKIIDDINSKQEEKQLLDNKEAVHRFAMDIVRDNLISGGRMSQEQVEKSYTAGYKSAGRDIGHVANNLVSKSVGFLNSYVQSNLEKAVKEKEWKTATLLTVTSIITKNIMNPFVGGGTNWVVRNATKAGIANPLSVVNIISDYAMKKDIDLNTETGRKNLEEALYRKANLQSTNATALVGTVISMLVFMALKDDDDENLLTLDSWIKENEWAKKYFEKLSPESATMLIALENEELGKHYIKSFGMKTDLFDSNLNLLKSLDKDNTSTLGIGASIVSAPFSTPGPWRMYRDIQNIKRGLNGIPPVKSNYEITSFWNGMFKGGFVDYLGYRPGAVYGTKEEINQEIFARKYAEQQKIPQSQLTKEETRKSIISAEKDVKQLKEFVKSQRKDPNKPYYISKDVRWTKEDLSISKAEELIKTIEDKILEVKNK